MNEILGMSDLWIGLAVISSLIATWFRLVGVLSFLVPFLGCAALAYY